MKRFATDLQGPGVLTSVSRAAHIPKAKAQALLEAAERRASGRARPTPTAATPLPPVPPPLGLPALAPSRPVRLRLPSGRSVRVLAPEVARKSDLEALRNVVATNGQRAFEAQVAQARAIDSLARGQSAIEQRLALLQEQADLALLGGLRGLAGVREQMAEVRAQSAQQGAALARGNREQRKILARQARATQVQSLNDAISTLETTAYGRKGDVFDTTNLALAGTQWLGGNLEPVLRRLGWISGPHTGALAWLGPLLGLALVQVTIGQQHDPRFVSGEVTLVAPGDNDDEPITVAVSVSLRDHLSQRSFDALRRRTDVPASTAVVAGPLGARTDARVRDGVLVVTSLQQPRGSRMRVVWTVDTGGPDD